MKTLSSVLFVIIVGSLSLNCNKKDCHKPQPQTLTDAIITGVDYRKCSCCGGLMITFTNDPTPYSAEFFNIREMPVNSGIDVNTTFPVYVKVKFSIPAVNCGNYADISVLEKR